jgi:hypothetical protein
MESRRVTVEQETSKRDQEGNPIFKIKKGAYKRSLYEWPRQFEIKKFLVQGFDEMTRFGGGRGTKQVWFYIIPDGLTQEVTIVCNDTKDKTGRTARQFRLVLNPFTVQFDVQMV